MKVYTVNECSEIISESIKKNYLNKNINVEGTVSSLREHFSGNCYFSLIDESYKISCKINHMHLSFVKRKLKSGEKVIISGNILYDKYFGKPLLLAERVIVSGKSQIQIEKEKLFKELEEKGYFSVYSKKALPEYVFIVGIITSKSGAVVHDIIKTGRLRNKNVSYYIYNSAVQGEKAALGMSKMIKLANKSDAKPDVLIIARGGGAEEDFRPFNEWILLDAVYNSEIPVVSAIGHEVDDVLLDMVADYRASTPTQAAELVVEEEKVLYSKIEFQLNCLKQVFKFKMENKKSDFIINLYKLRKSINKTVLFDKMNEIIIFCRNLKQGYIKNIIVMQKKCIENLIKLQESYINKF